MRVHGKKQGQRQQTNTLIIIVYTIVLYQLGLLKSIKRRKTYIRYRTFDIRRKYIKISTKFNFRVDDTPRTHQAYTFKLGPNSQERSTLRDIRGNSRVGVEEAMAKESRLVVRKKVCIQTFTMKRAGRGRGGRGGGRLSNRNLITTYGLIN